MILVVDMNWKRDSLAYTEFVTPIVAAVEGTEPVLVEHLFDLTSKDIDGSSRVILSGTTLKDFEAQKHLNKLRWIKTCQKPVLGICAGMQSISLVHGVALMPCMQVGMTQITTHKSNMLFRGSFQAYTLHSLSITPSETFETIATSGNCIQAIKHKQKPTYGVLFHPEVRNVEILKNFVKL